VPGSLDPGLPRLHILASERELADDSAVPMVERVLDRAGPVALHLRARLSVRRLYEVAIRLRRRAARTGAWVVVNGRPDVALAVSAQAVQLGRGALSVRDVRALVAARGSPIRIGVSVHGEEEAERAVREGADYVVLGTIHDTPSHPEIEGSGPEVVRLTVERLASSGSVPLLAIGGFDLGRARAAVVMGAHGVVVGRAIWGAPEPALAAAELRQALQDMDEGKQTMTST